MVPSFSLPFVVLAMVRIVDPTAFRPQSLNTRLTGGATAFDEQLGVSLSCSTKRLLRRRRSWERQLYSTYDKKTLLASRSGSLAKVMDMDVVNRYAFRRDGALLLRAFSTIDEPLWPVLVNDPIDAFLDEIAISRVLKIQDISDLGFSGCSDTLVEEEELGQKQTVSRLTVENAASISELAHQHRENVSEFIQVEETSGFDEPMNDTLDADDLAGLVIRMDTLSQPSNVADVLGVVFEERARTCVVQGLQTGAKYYVAYDLLEGDFPLATLIELRTCSARWSCSTDTTLAHSVFKPRL